MRVNNISIFAGESNVGESQNGKQNTKGAAGYSIDAGKLDLAKDPITDKKKQAQEKAMKIIYDAFSGEKAIEDDLDARRLNIERQSQIVKENNDFIYDIEAARNELRQQYQMDAESEEEKDLELLVKEAESQFKGSTTTLTEEEQERLKEIKAAGLTEYQQRSLSMKKKEAPYVAAVYDAKTQIQIENAVIRQVNLERLKSNPMAKAKDKAENVMKAAGDEIMGMLIEEGREHMDAVREEKVEKAEERAEKQEAQEEKIEAVKEKKEEQEELAEIIREINIDIMDKATEVSDAQREIKNMMSKMKLIEEDVKGATVDEEV